MDKKYLVRKIISYRHFWIWWHSTCIAYWYVYKFSLIPINSSQKIGNLVYNSRHSFCFGGYCFNKNLMSQNKQSNSKLFSKISITSRNINKGIGIHKHQLSYV